MDIFLNVHVLLEFRQQFAAILDKGACSLGIKFPLLTVFAPPFPPKESYGGNELKNYFLFLAMLYFF